MTPLVSWLLDIPRGLAAIAFISGGRFALVSGGMLTAAIALAEPRAAACGLLAALVGRVVGRGLGDPVQNQAAASANALLAGLGCALFVPGAAAWGMAAVAGGLAVAITAWLTTRLAQRGLPPLSLGFCLAVILVLLASPPGAVALPAVGSEPAPWWLGGLAALGWVMAVPSALVGAVLLALIAVRSPLAAGLVLGGQAVWVGLRGWMWGSWSWAAADPYAFNGALAALAVGGVLLVPGVRATLLGLAAAAAAALLATACERVLGPWGLPILALPMNLAVLATVGILAARNDRLVVLTPHPTPERCALADAEHRALVPPGEPIIAVPAAGTWQIYQAPHGPWTHRGRLANAWDLVIGGPAGRTYRDTGTQLDDYYAWQQPVLAPVAGTVVAAVGDRPDRPVGEPDQLERWGNHVVIVDDHGNYVLVAHLACDSLSVYLGSRVAVGDQIGRCGNSGYSPQPHIHVQVQDTPVPGSATRPFRFCGYRLGDEVLLAGAPPADATITATPPDADLVAATTWLLDRPMTWELISGSTRLTRTYAVTVDEWGHTWLRGDHGELGCSHDAGCLRMHTCRGTDPVLTLLATALPALPLGAPVGHYWQVPVPRRLVRAQPLWWLGLQTALSPSHATVPARCKRRAMWLIDTTIPGDPIPWTVHLDRQLGITAVHHGDQHLRLCANRPADMLPLSQAS